MSKKNGKKTVNFIVSSIFPALLKKIRQKIFIFNLLNINESRNKIKRHCWKSFKKKWILDLKKLKSGVYWYHVQDDWYLNYFDNSMWRGRSVGRATDWKSVCHRFDPGPCHHFYFNSLIYNDLCIENTQKTRVFFRFKFSVWRIWRTGGRHKATKILRFALFGDTAFMLKIDWFFAFQVKKK